MIKVALLFAFILLAIFAAATAFGLWHYRRAWKQAFSEQTRLRNKLVDWPELRRYRQANASLPRRTVRPRIVFLGDSIVERWPLDNHFPAFESINRGIGWQTSSEILARTCSDAVSLEPSAIVLIAGANDFSPEVGSAVLPETESNIRTIVEIAAAHRIPCVVGTLTPLCVEHEVQKPSNEVIALRSQFNEWIRTSCEGPSCELADFDAAMRDRACELLVDVSHPNDAGYRIMANVIARSIRNLGER